jgi:ureidoglycolate lyase
MNVVVQPLTAEAFEPYGEVLSAPLAPGRSYFESALGNARPLAHASLSMVRRVPVPGLPIEAKLLERHEFSSQSFVPIECGPWLVVVCPHAPQGGPDLDRVQAFLARPDQGVTYRMNTWHHGLTVLERPATMAVFMWRDGGSGDEEFVPVTPFRISAQ